MYSRPSSSLFISIALLFSGVVHGQSGSLSYGPTSIMQAVPVPIIGHWGLLLLALAVGGLGYRFLRRHQAGRVLGAMLSFSAALALVSGGLYIQDAGAPPLPVVNLDNPSGASVPVPEYFQEYQNVSGVEIEIEQLIDPCGGNAPNMAQNACAESLVLSQSESCATQFQCAQPQAEVCDGIDNDLDELIDDELFPPNIDCVGGDPVCTGVGGWQCPLVCTPDCGGKACGTDGCDGSCGSCSSGNFCNAGGSCVEPICGNGICEDPENTSTCSADCGSDPV